MLTQRVPVFAVGGGPFGIIEVGQRRVSKTYDLPNARDGLEFLMIEYGERLPIVAVSAETKHGLTELGKQIFEALEIIRVYTKAPRQKADLTHPIILKKGSTVEDVATNLHRELQQKLRYAQVWGSGKFSGQRVSRHYTPEDKDIIEIYT
jgi:hypothetical protein